jgi:hypothetical protein
MYTCIYIYIYKQHFMRQSLDTSTFLSQARTWISDVICRYFFCVQWVQSRWEVLFVLLIIRRKPLTCRMSLYHILLYTSPWSRFELTTSVVIGTDCIGSYKSNYHTITATTAADKKVVGLLSMPRFDTFIHNHKLNANMKMYL